MGGRPLRAGLGRGGGHWRQRDLRGTGGGRGVEQMGMRGREVVTGVSVRARGVEWKRGRRRGRTGIPAPREGHCPTFLGGALPELN